MRRTASGATHPRNSIMRELTRTPQQGSGLDSGKDRRRSPRGSGVPPTSPDLQQMGDVAGLSLRLLAMVLWQPTDVYGARYDKDAIRHTEGSVRV